MYTYSNSPVSSMMISANGFSGLGAAAPAPAYTAAAGPAWEKLDAVYPQLIVGLLQLQPKLAFTLNFQGSAKSWESDQAAQMPTLLNLIFSVDKVLGFQKSDLARSFLYLRAMGEYAEKTAVPADQARAFDLVKKIVWKFETPTGSRDWSPLIRKNKTVEISRVAGAVARGDFKKFKDFFQQFKDNTNTAYGNAESIYGYSASALERGLNTSGIGLTPAFFKPILIGNTWVPARGGFAPTPTYFTGARSAKFAALHFAVNQALSSAGVFFALRYLQLTLGNKSELGVALNKWLDFSKAAKQYKDLSPADSARVAAVVQKAGGPAKVEAAILRLYRLPFKPVLPDVSKAAVKAGAAVIKAATPTASTVKAAAAVKPEAAKTAAAKTLIAAASKGVKPALVAKIAAKQTKFFSTSLRQKLVVQTATLVDQKKTQEAILAKAQQDQTVAQAKVEAAPTPAAAEAAKVEVQAATQAVEQAQTAVAETTSKVEATEQAITQVDTAAAAAATAEQTAAKAAEAPPPATPEAAAETAAATEDAAKAASEAAAAATAAAATVLPPETVAEAAKESVEAVKSEAAQTAASTGDATEAKAVEAVAEAGIVKEAVKEGAAVAEDVKKAAGGSTLALLVGGAALAYLLFRK